MVLQVGGERRAAVLPGAQQFAIGVTQLIEQEGRACARRLHVVLALERRARVGERRHHQRVPGGQALVVEPGPGPPLAGLEQPATDLR